MAKHRCRSRQIFGDARIFCPRFPQTCPKKYCAANFPSTLSLGDGYSTLIFTNSKTRRNRLFSFFWRKKSDFLFSQTHWSLNKKQKVSKFLCPNFQGFCTNFR